MAHGAALSERGGGVYAASPARKRMFVVACNIQVFLVGDRKTTDRRRRTLSTCATFCDWEDDQEAKTPFNADSGMPYCEAVIVTGRSSYEFKALRLSDEATVR
jgi:hypothetical protein